MVDIFNEAGETIADIPLSEKQSTTLETGAEIVVIYHTPQMLRGVLGLRNGSFTLQKREGRILTLMPDVVKQYADLQKAIKSAREGT